jgi:mannose-6-phosphate isomerase-like protein (cupin superfamily)
MTTETKTAPGYTVSRGSAPDRIEGRREFFDYTDLGAKAGSGGKMRAQIMKARRGMVEDTGWHGHICEGQYIYLLGGWLDLQMVDGKTVRLEKGDSMYIPGGVPHNETGTSDDFELLEISMPADMGTELCAKPDF